MEFSTELIIEILKIVVYVVLGGLTLWFRENAKLKGTVADLIAEAEAAYKDTAKAGGMKYKYVVEKLYSLVPAYLKPIITKESIAGIVDRAFESIEEYGKMQLDKAVDAVVPDKK